MEQNNNSKIKNIEIISKKENQNILIDDEYNKSNESKNEEKNKNKNNNLIEENNFKYMNYEIQKINSDFTPYLKKEFEQIFKDKTLKDVENAMSSQKSKSKSNFSKYSEDSKKQILKMKDEISQYKKTIEEMKYKYKDYENENNKNEIEIIFTNNENKDYPIKIKVNKEEDIDKIIEYLKDKHPELKEHKDIKYVEYPAGFMEEHYGVNPHCSWVAVSDLNNLDIWEWLFSKKLKEEDRWNFSETSN